MIDPLQVMFLLVVLLSSTLAAFASMIVHGRKKQVAAALDDNWKDDYIREFATMIGDYHEIIAHHTGRSRLQQKREFMQMMKANLPVSQIKILVKYLEDDMSADDFVIDMTDDPRLFQRFISFAYGK